MFFKPRIKVIYFPLLWLTWHIRAGISIAHLSILGIVVSGRRYMSYRFFIISRDVFFQFFSVQCLKPSIKDVLLRTHLISFLFNSKFLSFPICLSVRLLIHYYYYYHIFITTSLVLIIGPPVIKSLIVIIIIIGVIIFTFISFLVLLFFVLFFL